MNTSFGKSISLLVLLAVFAGCAPVPQDPPRLPASQAQASPLVLDVHVSQTAQLFHLVDNASQWSEFCHSQYRKYLESLPGGLSERDLELLAEHATLRSSLSWGQGLEQAFYTPKDLDEAIADAVARKLLTPEQAEVERRVLRHFSDRSESLLNSESQQLSATKDVFQRREREIADVAKTLSRFCGTKRVVIPVYILANPSSSSLGGGYNGGILTIEAAKDADLYPTLLHEVCHAFLDTRESSIRSATAGVDEQLDYMTMSEAIAYAFAPGVYGYQAEDRLVRLVEADIVAGKGLDDNYAKFHRYALALRPLLRPALEDDSQTILTFLPKAVDVWRVVASLNLPSRVRHRGWFIIGPGWQSFADLPGKPGFILSGRHSNDFYARVLTNAEEGSVLFLLFALDNPDINVPEAYRSLLPQAWDKIETVLRQGKTFESKTQTRGLSVVVLGAPTLEQLKTLIKTSDLTREGRN